MKRFTLKWLSDAALSAIAVSTAFATSAGAQDFTAMINAQMGQMNAMINNGNQQINGWVQQKMQDPQVQAQYRNYTNQARMGGMPVQDFRTWTYNYIYTNGYSASGMAAARANEDRNTARVASSAAALRQAEANRGAAQQNMQQHYSNNQREAGNMLMGNSTYTAPNGQQMVLPHTWQPNNVYNYNGDAYRVDQSGNYFVLGTDRNWYPLRR